MYSLMARLVVMVARNALAPEKMKAHGFECHSFGRSLRFETPTFAESRCNRGSRYKTIDCSLSV
jgi:hypothetical protein